MYVDNCVTSVDYFEELESFQRDFTERYWHWVISTYMDGDSDIQSNFDFQDNQQKSDPQKYKFLDSMWECEKEDTLSISYRETESKEVTKRRIFPLAHIDILNRIGFITSYHPPSPNYLCKSVGR
ncbi:hypothetical protein TNCV_4636381 [Trichonephila clavipes]|nr:hypothetical protein TNCV_4636381 [Trichonephila clavipes]